MSTLPALVSGSLEATVLALLALFLYQVHRQVGVIPLVFLMGCLALLVPLGAHAATLELGAWGSTPQVYAIVVPVYIGLTLLMHLLFGARNALAAAALPALAGVLAGLVAVASRFFGVFVPVAFLPPSPAGAVIGGLSLSLACLATLYLFRGAAQVLEDTRLPIPIVLAILVGASFQGLLLVGAASTGWVTLQASWPGALAIPVVVGLVPTLFIGIFIGSQAGELSEDQRRELTQQSPLGSETMVGSFERAERMYKEGVIHGRQIAERYLELLDTQPEGIYVCDPRGKITYANPALARLLGQKGTELTGQNVTHLLGSRSTRGRPQPTRDAVEPGEHKIPVTLPNGRTRLVEVHVEEISEGRLHGHVTDLSHELVRLELERQRKRATFYVRMLCESVDTTAPVARRGLATLASLDAVQEDGSARDAVSQARAALAEIEALVSHVELLDRIEEITPAPVDATDLLKTAAERGQTRLAGRTVSATLQAGPAVVKGSPVVGDALDTLIDLAHQHAGVEMPIELGLSAHPPGGWLLKVSYTGDPPGQEVQEILAGQRSPRGNGHRLGAYAVRALAAALGGSSRVETGPASGGGTETRLLLQLPAPPSQAASWRAGTGQEPSPVGA